MRKLAIPDIEQIAEAIEFRRTRFDEPFATSVGVVLLNYGSRSTQVYCVGGEWSGTKADLVDLGQGHGVPLCPNRHPILEGSGRQVLALIDDTEPPPGLAFYDSLRRA